jgi:non-heme chloroperoxidase
VDSIDRDRAGRQLAWFLAALHQPTARERTEAAIGKLSGAQLPPATTKVAKAVLISSVPPLMVKTPDNPGGLPKEVFDGFQEQVADNRSKFYRDLAAGPFYGFNRPGVEPSEAIIDNWWRQGMMGGAKPHYDGIVAFSQTDFTEDLKKISVPVLVMHGDDDQIVPYADSGPLSAKLLRNGTLKTYHGFPHGMPTTQAATINADLLAFLRG